MPGRDVTLVLCTGDGELLGAAAPFAVAEPGWREVEDVVAAAQEVLRVGVRVLRVLEVPTDADFPGGGRVAYLVEVDGRPKGARLHEWPGDPTAPHPHRASYAEPGGHRRDLDWVETTLGARQIALTRPPVQVRTWNLSSIWRLSTTDGVVWLKVTPAFCASEAVVMPLLDERVAPAVLGAAPNRVLLADVPGTDQYDARGEVLRPMVQLLVSLQAAWAHRPELERLGVLDKRAPAMLAPIDSVVAGNGRELDDDVRRRLDDLVDDLPTRYAALESCGIPDTLVHGDFHPGNVRGTPGSYRVLDWADCGIGNPMLDLRPSFEHFTAEEQRSTTAMFVDAWSAAVPGCDARRAAELARPLGPLYGAVVYQRFLDSIEPDERPYHEGDPAHALRSAVAAAR